MTPSRILVSCATFAIGTAVAMATPAESGLDMSTQAALAAIKGGDVAAAENALTEGSRRPKGSPEWNLHVAHLLYRIAFRATGEADSEVIDALANRALELLASATRSGGLDRPSLGEAWELAGVLNQNIRADFGAARQCYENAVAADPDRATAAAKLKRLKAAQATANAKAKGRS